MAISAEQLNVILSARDREFTRAMERAERRVQRFSNQSNKSLSQTSQAWGALGSQLKMLLPALSAGILVAETRRVVAELDSIGKTADRLGLTTDALQELRVAAESAGVSSNTLDMAMQRFGRRLAEARNGAGRAKGALEEMGIELFNADGTARETMAVLNDVADAMKGMSVQTDRNRIAMRLFDSEGVALVNMLRDGSAALDKKRQSARELGIVLEEDLIRGAEDAEDQLGLMAQVVKAQLSRALIELAPLLVGGAKLVAELAAAFGLAIRGINDFLYPQSELEIATSNIVLAMADEIRQTQQLKAAMAQGATMSVDMAQKKLAEAVARREHARAAIEERRESLLHRMRCRTLTVLLRGNRQRLMLSPLLALKMFVGQWRRPMRTGRDASLS